MQPGLEAAIAPASASPADGVTTLHRGAPGLVEGVRCESGSRERGPLGHMARFHFVAPLRGSYVWYSGGEQFFADPACILYAPANDTYAVAHPLGGDTSVVITPSDEALGEAVGGAGTVLANHEMLQRRSRAADPELQLMLRRLLAAAEREAAQLEMDELAAAAIRRLLATGTAARRPAGPAAARTIRQAKAYLHDHLASTPSLAEVAQAVGVSPCHLTHLFTQCEGAPLYRYQLMLRLSMALEALPRSEDLTTLALELGFSSHSHFSSMFRAQFGVTPSAVRAELSARSLAPASSIARAPRGPRQVRPLCAARGGRPI